MDTNAVLLLVDFFGRHHSAILARDFDNFEGELRVIRAYCFQSLQNF